MSYAFSKAKEEEGAVQCRKKRGEVEGGGRMRVRMNRTSGGGELSLVDVLRLLLQKVGPSLGKAAAVLVVAALVMRMTRKRKSLKDKLVLVTGAATGIGREQAFKFAKAGAKLAIWDINMEMLEKTAEDVRKATGAQVEAYKVNLADKEAVYACADEVRAKQGHVQVLVNNAGIISGQELLDTPDNRIELSMKVNAMAYFWTAKAFLPEMLKNNSGHIVGISSAAGIFPAPRMIDYCTSKFAARGFMEALHTELHYLGKTGVKTTVVCPAHVNTDLFKGYNMGGTMSPQFVAQQVVDAVQYGRFHVYLPWYLQAGVFWQQVIPSDVWDFFIGLSYSAMKNWKPEQANKIFKKME